MNIKIKNRALSHVGNGFKPFLQAVPRTVRKAARSGTVPYRLGASERLETVPYRLYKLAEELDIVWTVPRCMDCSTL